MNTKFSTHAPSSHTEITIRNSQQMHPVHYIARFTNSTIASSSSILRTPWHDECTQFTLLSPTRILPLVLSRCFILHGTTSYFTFHLPLGLTSLGLFTFLLCFLLTFLLLPQSQLLFPLLFLFPLQYAALCSSFFPFNLTLEVAILDQVYPFEVRTKGRR